MFGKIKEAISYWCHKLYNSLYVKFKCASIYKYMLDTESKRILRLKEIIYPSYVRFIKNFINGDCSLQFEIPELESYKRVIVCLMDTGRATLDRMNYTKILLEHSKWKDLYECIKIEDGFQIQTGDIVVPVWGSELDKEILKQKAWGGQVHIPKYCSILIGGLGKQYFGIFAPGSEEIVVDAGACDGTTELEIAEWTNYAYKKIYAFEPNEINCIKCEQFYKDNELHNIELIQKGTWSQNTTLSFSAEQGKVDAGGRITDDGSDSEKVVVTTIDDVVGDDKVTFIKMDVEGAELESLKGAAETIKRNTPRLAICIYHKKEDLWTIPKCILEMNSKYRFYIRHYTSMSWETVLYAIVP